MARIATWSVVEDVSASCNQQKEVLDLVSLQEPKFPLFRVPQIGVVPGEQTLARAELFAVVIAAMKANLLDPIPYVEVVTDASYVCKVVRLIELGLVMSILHKLTNSELISRLATLWHKDKFKVIKIKSRRNLESAVKHDDLWTIAGKHCADVAAEAASALVRGEIRMLVDELVKHVENEKMSLRSHCRDLVDLNVKRCQLIDALKDKPVSTLIQPRQEAQRDFKLFDSHAMGRGS